MAMGTGGAGTREEARLTALERLDVVRYDADEVLQGLVDDAREAFETDLVVVHLMVPDGMYFRAWSGPLPEELAETKLIPNEMSMCPPVVEGASSLVVEDLSEDEGYREHFVCAVGGMRFYAGTPLVTSEGTAIGTLCLLGHEPRRFSEDRLRTLRAFGRAVVGRLETLGALGRERAAREEEARRGRELQRILSSAGEGIVGLDPGGKIEFANPAAAAMLGYAPDELIGENMHDLVHHSYPDGTPYPKEECPNYVALRDGRAHRSDGDVYWRKDGASFPVEYASNPVVEGGRVVGAVVTFSDVAERKEAEEELRRQRDLYETLLRAQSEVGEGLIIVEGRRIVYANEAFREISGYSTDELEAMPSVVDLLPVEGRTQAEEGLRQRISLPEGSQDRREATILHKSGRPVHAELGLKPLRVEGRPRLIAVLRDVTERKRAEEALRESEERFRSLVQNASDLITVMAADGAVLYESPAIERMLGYAPGDLVGENAFSYVHPDDAPRVLRAFARLSEEGAANPYVEYRFRHKDGSWRHLESSGANLLDEPSVKGIVVNSRDVTERKELEERLVHQALHDPLTGLPNRALLLDRLGHALERADRGGASRVAVLFLDLDDFKVVNDSLGHEAGDTLLVGAAGRLETCLRPGDTLARLGGDEFVVLLEDVSGRGEATGVVERIAEALRGPFPLGAHEEVFVSASIGVALGTTGGDRGRGLPEDLLRRADVAMYEAKRRGKAHHEVFEARMDDLALGRLRMGTDLRRAAERGEFRVHYQPEVELSTGRVVGFEALVRWEHPEQGLVPPARFIPVAEQTGMIVPIGRWVLEESCRQAKAWQDDLPNGSPTAMSVNLSARQFGHPDLARDVARALEKSGLDAGCLVLEITESVVMDDARSTVDTLGELKSLGVRLAIDDFGTGYSSLSYLRRFPVDYLKVDRSFVDGLGEDPGDVVLVSGIVDLAHALGLSVIAEGVETEEQLGLLREMGCDLAQGYHFAKPLPGEGAAALLPGA